MKKALLLFICAVITLNTACSKSNSSKKNDTNINENQTVVSNGGTENKPETKSETTPEVKSDEKTKVKPETKPESKPSSKPQTKSETKPDSKPSTKPETKPATKPSSKPETKPEDNILKGDLKDIIEKIYSISEVKLPKTGLTEVTAENSKYFLGTNNVEYVEALASEPLIGSYPHSLVLLRVKDGADIDKIKAEIKNSVDPRKWICVGVEPENVIVDNIDNLIILIMDNESEKLHKAFLSLKK